MCLLIIMSPLTRGTGIKPPASFWFPSSFLLSFLFILTSCLSKILSKSIKQLSTLQQQSIHSVHAEADWSLPQTLAPSVQADAGFWLATLVYHYWEEALLALITQSWCPPRKKWGLWLVCTADVCVCERAFKRLCFLYLVKRSGCEWETAKIWN